MLGPYIVAGAFGAGVGIAELVSRYRDSTVRTFVVPGAWVYVIINAGASVGALYLIRAFGWDFGQTTTAKRDLMQILVASFGALAFFRSSLLIVKVGDQQVSAGPYLLLSSLLSAADRSVDRHQAERRNTEVARIMNKVDFDKASISLPTICLAASASTTSDQGASLRGAIAKVASDSMSSHAKALALGLAIVDLLGVDVLEASKSALGDEINFVEPSAIKPSPPVPLPA